MAVDRRTGRVPLADALDDVWNTDEIIEVRTAMARGERPAARQDCWKVEDIGGASRRALTNQAYVASGGAIDLELLATLGAESGFGLNNQPEWLVLEMGRLQPKGPDLLGYFKLSDSPRDRQRGPAQRHLSLLGGEPFLSKHTHRAAESSTARPGRGPALGGWCLSHSHAPMTPDGRFAFWAWI